MTTFGELSTQGALLFSDGYRTKHDQLGSTGFRVLRVADVQHGWVTLDGDDFVVPEYAPQIGAKAAMEGDVLLTTKGTIGRVAVIGDLGAQQVVYSPQLCFFRVLDHERISSRYLRYWLSSNEAVHQISIYSGNTDMAPYLSLRDLKSMRLTLPALHEQEGIAGVLGALDDKIAANRRVIATADTLRATLWLRLCRDSEPRPLSGLSRFINGRAFTKGATGTGRVVVRIAELNSGLSGSTVRNDIDVADDHVARPGDFLMAWSGSLTAARWFRDEAIVNQHIFKVIPTEGRSLWSVACAVDSKMADFKHEAAGKATTMGHIQRRHLDEPVLWPVLNDESEAQGQALWERALVAERENETLAKIRDELLPLLMSGKITVRDAEKRVEGVV
ncbi:restriction endonuclease subunit S [Dermacoccus abyssi]|uniref:restriction endonuclease subunit S n=1 Tax=Dermacoccus abyssi TaxID=322596 RepID=UPI0021A83B48|nr:restriction endonuclease subunit S [Dermacoccus abyssi]MCT1986757.1 restriction endonuclease subunit S [Dermacoccus abyssi]